MVFTDVAIAMSCNRVLSPSIGVVVSTATDLTALWQ